MKVLVTGGAGYIGSHTVRALARSGHDVVIFDNLSTGFRRLATGFPLLVGDLADKQAVQRALERVDVVMHFAAHAYVGESVQHPRKYFENNVSAGLTLLGAAVEAGIKRFVFSSTCAVYGVPSRMPIAEDTPRTPINPYGATKLAFENALQAYGAAYGMKYAILRYFNAAGADECGEIGELHNPETHLIPLALSAVNGGRVLDVYGSDYATGDGTCIRDYIHVSDLADAHVRAVQGLSDVNSSIIVNLGTGTGFSVREVISAVERITGRTVPIRHCDRRPGDPAVLVADNTKARRILGWSPSRTLENIVESAWKWTLSYTERGEIGAEPVRTAQEVAVRSSAGRSLNG